MSTKEMEVLTKDGGVVMGDNVDLRAERKGSGIRSLKRRSSISKTTSRALPAHSLTKKLRVYQNSRSTPSQCSQSSSQRLYGAWLNEAVLYTHFRN